MRRSLTEKILTNPFLWLHMDVESCNNLNCDREVSIEEGQRVINSFLGG